MKANELGGKENFLKSIHYLFYYLIAYSLNMCDLGLDVPIGRP